MIVILVFVALAIGQPPPPSPTPKASTSRSCAAATCVSLSCGANQQPQSQYDSYGCPSCPVCSPSATPSSIVTATIVCPAPPTCTLCSSGNVQYQYDANGCRVGCASCQSVTTILSPTPPVPTTVACPPLPTCTIANCGSGTLQYNYNSYGCRIGCPYCSTGTSTCPVPAPCTYPVCRYDQTLLYNTDSNNCIIGCPYCGSTIGTPIPTTVACPPSPTCVLVSCRAGSSLVVARDSNGCQMGCPYCAANIPTPTPTPSSLTCFGPPPCLPLGDCPNVIPAPRDANGCIVGCASCASSTQIPCTLPPCPYFICPNGYTTPPVDKDGCPIGCSQCADPTSRTILTLTTRIDCPTVGQCTPIDCAPGKELKYVLDANGCSGCPSCQPKCPLPTSCTPIICNSNEVLAYQKPDANGCQPSCPVCMSRDSTTTIDICANVRCETRVDECDPDEVNMKIYQKDSNGCNIVCKDICVKRSASHSISIALLSLFVAIVVINLYY